MTNTTDNLSPSSSPLPDPLDDNLFRAASDWPVITAGKRLGITQAPWMAGGDWFVAWSPRNDNTHGEGYWDHWVDLALKILQHPATSVVYPRAHDAVVDIPSSSSAAIITVDTTDTITKPGAS